MQALLDTLVLAQYGATALSAAFNTWYFATYRTREGRRRVGAAVMAVVSLALAVESVAVGWLLYPRASDGFLWLTSGTLALAGSLLISTLIILRRRSGRP
ncbi:MAG: hypothetical protein HY676_05595 [Chloroflexi bacterium]|nr:hypothetical protein [Chloroflexota bacterium]